MLQEYTGVNDNFTGLEWALNVESDGARRQNNKELIQSSRKKINSILKAVSFAKSWAQART